MCCGGAQSLVVKVDYEIHIRITRIVCGTCMAVVSEDRWDTLNRTKVHSRQDTLAQTIKRFLTLIGVPLILLVYGLALF